MTNRLHILERERKRLEEALADDPHWQAFCEAQKRDPAAGRLHVLSSDIVAGLTQSSSFAAYIKVIRAINRIKTTAPTLVQAQRPPDAANANTHPSRTLLQPKPAPSSSQSDVPLVVVDDLTAIRRIDRELEKALNTLGIFSYRAIAEWDRHAVRSVRDSLNLGKRIWRENWIEQAALLRLRQLEALNTAALVHEPVKHPVAPIKLITLPPTELAAPVPASTTSPLQPNAKPVEPTSRSAASAVETVPIVSAAQLPESARASVPGDADAAALPERARPAECPETRISAPSALASSPPESPPRTTIKVGRRRQRLPAPAARRFSYLLGVSDQLSEALRSAGVKSIAEIATWSRSDVKWFQAILGHEARISRDQWIEQAALLSKGIWTRHALRVVNGDTRQVIPPPAPLDLGTPTLGDSEPASMDAVVADEQTEAFAPVSVAETAPTELPGPVASPIPDGGVLTGTEIDPSEAVPAIPVAVTAAPQPPALDTLHNPAPPPVPPVSPAADSRADDAIANTADTENLPDTSPPLLTPVDPAKPPSRNWSALGKIKRPPPDLGTRKPHDSEPEATLPPPIPDSMPQEPFAAQMAVPATPPPTRKIDKIDEPLPQTADHAAPTSIADIETIDLDITDDLDDAEALIIKRSEPVAEPVDVRAKATETSLLATEPPVTNQPSSAPSQTDDADAEDEPTWGDEAEVVIVSRHRPKVETETPVSDPAAPPARQKAEPIGALRSVVNRRHIQDTRRFDMDDLGEPRGGYRDSIEEASVTIIRAEASQENAASVVPSEIANDADSPAPTVRKSSSRAIRSRFLKALTGD